MQIEIKGRHGAAVTEELRKYANRRFEKVSRQVSDLARLELELREEHNPAIADRFVVDAVIYLKGGMLRASARSFDMKHALHAVSDDTARQVLRHKAKRQRRREAQRFNAKALGSLPGALPGATPLDGLQPGGAQI